MSDEGHLSNPAVQDKLRAEERKLSAIEAADLDALLRQRWGRRLYYRPTFLLAGLESSSYAPSGQYMAYLEGRRSIGITLRDEAQLTSPELWDQMVVERRDDLLQAKARRDAIHNQPKQLESDT